MRRQRSGFTLIELLAALVLGSLLLWGAASVAKSAGRLRQSWLQQDHQPPSLDQAAAVIRRDVELSRQMEAQPNRVRLIGLLGHDDRGTATLQLAEVTYTIAAGTPPMLLRHERLLGPGVSSAGKSDLVAAGVAGLQLIDVSPLGAPPIVIEPPIMPGLSTTPQRLRLILGNAAGEILVRNDIFHHWEAEP